ncbi:kinesin [Trichoderma sp. TUCIM 5745]
MDPIPRSQHLFDVFLRLRPPHPGGAQSERILDVEQPEHSPHPTHITLNPPPDRRKAVEKFGFTQIFEEDEDQLDVFHCTDTSSLIEGILAPEGGDGTDAVIATLGVTGSGKTHTILGDRHQRGIAQLATDVIFRSISENMVESAQSPTLDSLQACDASESTLVTATHFLDTMSGDSTQRSTTPMMVRTQPALSFDQPSTPSKAAASAQQMPGSFPDSATASPKSVEPVMPCDPAAEYVVVVSMYEVHNDRIYDLLTPASKSPSTKELRRRPLLFKPTEHSPDRKVVAGLRKVVCTDVREAILVLETGLQERRVASTGSNNVSSRSHGFFCFEVKKRSYGWRNNSWSGSKLTIVDLAGSERARDAKTQGATLAEAGKINESLMYLGQCLQAQSEANGSSKQPNAIPYRQCKLTEILFSNSFASAPSTYNHVPSRNPQRGVMIVTADPLGDFNATSQILRYSALAREATVPRAPSFSGGMLSPGSNGHGTPRSFGNNGFGSVRSHFSPVTATDERVTMEIAALEIARMSDEIEQLRGEIDIQSEARIAAEAHLLSAEDRMIDIEAAIREECALEFEQRLAMELARFKASMQIEKERHEEHWDRKVDILERSLDSATFDQGFDKENVLVENLTQEVERLRRENTILKREMGSRSPSKRKPLEEREDYSMASGGGDSTLKPKSDSVQSLNRKLERLKVGDGPRLHANPGSPKKVRRLVARRWEDSDGL